MGKEGEEEVTDHLPPLPLTLTSPRRDLPSHRFRAVGRADKTLDFISFHSPHHPPHSYLLVTPSVTSQNNLIRVLAQPNMFTKTFLAALLFAGAVSAQNFSITTPVRLHCVSCRRELITVSQCLLFPIPHRPPT